MAPHGERKEKVRKILDTTLAKSAVPAATVAYNTMIPMLFIIFPVPGNRFPPCR
jgi:hypothetical protein